MSGDCQEADAYNTVYPAVDRPTPGWCGTGSPDAIARIVELEAEVARLQGGVHFVKTIDEVLALEGGAWVAIEVGLLKGMALAMPIAQELSRRRAGHPPMESNGLSDLVKAFDEATP